jgi:hypothetical protein
MDWCKCGNPTFELNAKVTRPYMGVKVTLTGDDCHCCVCRLQQFESNLGSVPGVIEITGDPPHITVDWKAVEEIKYPEHLENICDALVALGVLSYHRDGNFLVSDGGKHKGITVGSSLLYFSRHEDVVMWAYHHFDANHTNNVEILHPEVKMIPLKGWWAEARRRLEKAATHA